MKGITRTARKHESYHGRPVGLQGGPPRREPAPVAIVTNRNTRLGTPRRCHDHHTPDRHRRHASCHELEQALEPLGQPALSRPPDLPVGPQARRHRLRADERSQPRAPRTARSRRFSIDDARRRPAQEQSVDGTTQFLLRLADGKHIESVFIPEHRRRSREPVTFCLSTQVGCAMRCALLPDRQDGHRSAT